jgi:hypothetical protein
MKVYIANFGRENYAWPQCLERNTVATMNRFATHPFWVAGDREGFIRYQLRHMRTAAGIAPIRPVASRWFNLMTAINNTAGDIWIHRQKDQLWWTRSKSDAATIEPSIDPTIDGDQRVFICHKPCEPWSNKNQKGNRLEWGTLHPKAQAFLFTEGTLQRLHEDNAAYAMSLIEGADLDRWESQSTWRTKLQRSRKNPGVVFNSRQKTIARMASTAMATAAVSNGQEVLRTVKDKQVRFSLLDLESYIGALIDAQEGLCALTGIPLQFDAEEDDPELVCSLDRIDSDGHYEAGNLQVVCKFANRWKNNGRDADFRRLIGVVRSTEPLVADS